VFSGAIRRIEGNLAAGETIEVLSSEGQFLARGAYSPASQIRIRAWTFDASESIDATFFAGRISNAIRLRDALRIPESTNAYRLISAEADGLPGLVVDRYGDWLVCQFFSVGSEFWKKIILDALKVATGASHCFERADVDIRKKEGLSPTTGPVWGDAPPPLIEMNEHDIKFYVDIKAGHKTGFYLDQRVNRQFVRSQCAGADVLNCFAYTGSFGLAALKGGARHVTNVDDVAGLVEQIDGNVRLNQIPREACENVKANVFHLLRQLTDEGKRYDVIILDPPKFAETQGHLPRASRGYKDINRLAFGLLKPGGLLFTFSCSGLMKMDLFQKIVADAAIDAGRDAQILEWLGQSPDHPVMAHIPETSYLKGLCLRVNL